MAQSKKPLPSFLQAAAMANSQTDSNQIHRLSDLHDELLVTIISFLPTHIAARTSVLCRRFRHLWEASPSLAFISRGLPSPPTKNFVAMAERTLLHRNPSQSLLSLHIEVFHCGRNATGMISSLLAKARSLHLRHLTIEGILLSDFLAILPVVFTINSLRCLSIDFYARRCYQELNFPSGINLTSLRSLYLELIGTDLPSLNQLLSDLSFLEDLHILLSITPRLCLSSQTIRKLKLIITYTPKLHIVELSLPSLVSLHLEIWYCPDLTSHIHANIPLLRKAVIKHQNVHERDGSAVAGLLNCISHVEDLSLHLQERTNQEYPIPILSGKDVPKFSNLKHLDATLSFHEQNMAAIIMMLHNCPILKSLKLVHKERKIKDWESKLPRNADGNHRYAYFRNLHLEEESKEFMKLLSKKCTSMKQAVNSDLHSPAK